MIVKRAADASVLSRGTALYRRTKSSIPSQILFLTLCLNAGQLGVLICFGAPAVHFATDRYGICRLPFSRPTVLSFSTFDVPISRSRPMEWTTPQHEEIDLNCEISSYANAEL